MRTPKTKKTTFDARIKQGNCLELIKKMPDCSVDSIVTDPPYELGFMGKKWDASGIAYSVELWRECLRVLKPGGHLLAFGGTRTYHRMAVAIEDAGFEIRDSIHWTYGSGFPKSLNVGKAIQAQQKTGSSSPSGQRKAAMGKDYTPTPLAGTPGYGTTGNFQNKDTGGAELELTSPVAQAWSGWGTALKPSHEPIVVARKPLDGTVASNVLTWGTGALNINGTRVGQPDGFGGGAKATSGFVDGYEGDGFVASTQGRWPANTIITHSPDCEQVGTRTDDITLNGEGNDNLFEGNFGGGHDQSPRTSTTPVWRCAPGCPAAELDVQSGVSTSRVGKPRGTAKKGLFVNSEFNAVGTEHSDTGGASRFFTQTTYTEADWPVLIYQAKPGKRERNAGLEGMPERKAGSLNMKTDSHSERNDMATTPAQNFHPTVKPVELMRHLIRLVTPKGGVVLDPFLGSGTTAVAAILEGFDWLGCEMTADYWPIIQGRITWAQAEVAKGIQQALPLE
jgi:site-specific DNA-methyltransferase (adenine-specific)